MRAIEGLTANGGRVWSDPVADGDVRFSNHRRIQENTTVDRRHQGVNGLRRFTRHASPKRGFAPLWRMSTKANLGFGSGTILRKFEKGLTAFIDAELTREHRAQTAGAASSRSSNLARQNGPTGAPRIIRRQNQSRVGSAALTDRTVQRAQI
jgi:hypothetical protein